jgi:hypothetical protein
MNLDDVKKLSPLDRLCYFVRERHNIYLRRKAGKPKPWTEDPILQRNYFCNVYRELDKTTVWFRENVRDPLRHDPMVVLATVIFRWFNFIPTGELLLRHHLFTDWNPDLAEELLVARRNEGKQVFTGAYMIVSPAGEPKIEGVVRRISKVWSDRESLLKRCLDWKRMETAHADLMRYEGLGGFMSYEIVCDLRYTDILDNAPDRNTWCNPGPGAVRGLYRVLEWDFQKGDNSKHPPTPKDWQLKTQELLEILQRRLRMKFEMREVEHLLCEWDKHERLLMGDGRSKRRYNGNV